MSLESGSKSEPKPKAKVEIPELPPAPTDEERAALELKEQQKKEAREKKEQEAEKRRKEHADAYTAREQAGGKDPVVDGSEVVPGADVNREENEAFNDFDFDTFIVNDLLPKFEGDSAFIYDLNTSDKDVAQTFIAGVQNKLDENVDNAIQVSLAGDENSFSMKVEKLDREPTPEEVKENRLKEIIKELEQQWEAKNGPMHRVMTKKEIKDAKEWEEVNGRVWDGSTTKFTDEANEFFYDHRGNGKNSVPDQAKAILLERYPEYAVDIQDDKKEDLIESTKNNTYDFENDPEYIQFLKKEASDRDIEDIIDLRNPPKHLPDGTTFSMFIADVQKRYIQKNPGVEAQMRNVEREQIVTERKTEAMKDIELAIKDELYYQDAGVDDTLNKGAQRKQKLAESYISAGLITQEEVDLLEKNIAYEKSILEIADRHIKDKIIPELEKRGVSEIMYDIGALNEKMAQSIVVAIEKRLNQNKNFIISLVTEDGTFKIKVEKTMRQEVGSITRYPKTGKLSFTNSATGKQVQVGYNPKKPNAITLAEKTTLMDIDGTQVDLSAEKKNWDGIELNMNEAMNLLGVENILFLVDSKSLAEQIGFPGIKDITYISSIVPKDPNSVEVTVPDRLYFTNPQTDKKVEVVYDPFDEVFILSEDPSVYELENGDTAEISKDGDMKNWDGIRIGLEEGKRLFKSPALHEFLVARGLEKKKEDINTNFLGLARKDDVKGQQAERKSNLQPFLDYIGKWFDGFGV